MESILKYLTERRAAIVLPMVLLAAGLFPHTVLADGEMGLDTRGRGGGREGDPLDGNEPDGDPTGGDDIHDTAGKFGFGDGLISQIMRSTNVLLVPQFNGSVLTFKVIHLSKTIEVVEGRYAQ